MTRVLSTAPVVIRPPARSPAAPPTGWSPDDLRYRQDNFRSLVRALRAKQIQPSAFRRGLLAIYDDDLRRFRAAHADEAPTVRAPTPIPGPSDRQSDGDSGARGRDGLTGCVARGGDRFAGGSALSLAQHYHRLSEATADHLGGYAGNNWAAWAKWRTLTVARFARGLNDDLRQLIGRSERDLFVEMAAAFAAFNRALRIPAPARPKALAQFWSGLQPGHVRADGVGGQGLLRLGFEHYWAAARADAPDARRAFVQAGTLQLERHAQARRQRFIDAARTFDNGARVASGLVVLRIPVGLHDWVELGPFCELERPGTGHCMPATRTSALDSRRLSTRLRVFEAWFRQFHTDPALRRAPP